MAKHLFQPCNRFKSKPMLLIYLTIEKASQKRVYFTGTSLFDFKRIVGVRVLDWMLFSTPDILLKNSTTHSCISKLCFYAFSHFFKEDVVI